MIAVVGNAATVVGLFVLVVVGFWLGLRAPARHERSVSKHRRPPDA
jgi:hypothetical protein